MRVWAKHIWMNKKTPLAGGKSKDYSYDDAASSSNKKTPQMAVI